MSCFIFIVIFVTMGLLLWLYSYTSTTELPDVDTTREAYTPSVPSVSTTIDKKEYYPVTNIKHYNLKDDIVVLDVETTGFDPRYNDILQCSIIDGNGKVLFNEYCRPSKKKKWADAQAVNGISPDDVKDCLTFSDFSPMVRNILKKYKLIIGWNVEFDLNFLSAKDAIPANALYCDAMKTFKYAHPESRYRLIDAAKYYNVSFNAHNSVEDCKATLEIFTNLSKEPYATFDIKRWDKSN